MDGRGSSAGLRVGDRAPVCAGMTAGRAFYSFEEQYGRPVVLILAGADAKPALSPAIAGVVRLLDAFVARHADVLLVVDDNPRGIWPGAPAPLQMVDCGTFLVRCGVGVRECLVLVLDRNMRIALLTRPEDRDDLAGDCLACIDSMPREEPREISLPAPVVMLPNLLSGDMCRGLIEHFESSPTIDGAVARVGADGRVQSVVDHKKKHRRDMALDPDEELHRDLQRMLLDRCVPEIAKAFQVQTKYTDRILIARYDDTGGYFRRHRDNAAKHISFREFALSVNLNSEDYEGGDLLFPEYNDHRYKPSTGAGVIFSTGLLHEAAPVRRGRRYVLLTFFHSEAAEVRRHAYDAGRL